MAYYVVLVLHRHYSIMVIVTYPSLHIRHCDKTVVDGILVITV